MPNQGCSLAFLANMFSLNPEAQLVNATAGEHKQKQLQ